MFIFPGARQAPITVAVENLMEGKQGTPEFDGYTVFDPKAPAGRAGLDRAKGFKEAVVFIIGGGNYLERETLVSWGQKCQPAKHIVYGATELLTGDDVMQQLTELGRRAGLK